jgi:hypothetical protein
MSMARRHAGNRTRVPRLHEPAVAGARTVTGPVEDTLLLSEVEQPRPVEAHPNGLIARFSGRCGSGFRPFASVVNDTHPEGQGYDRAG